MRLFKLIGAPEIAGILAISFWASGVGLPQSAYISLVKARNSSKLGESDLLGGKLGGAGGVEGKVAASRVTSGIDMLGRIKDKLPVEAERALEEEAALDSAELLKAQDIIESAINEKKKTATIIVTK